MPNPGTFQGSRKEFLLAQKPVYAKAVAEGLVADTIADIQRCYFKRYPIELALDVEPSPEWIAQVDDGAADPEVSPPDPSALDEDAYESAMAAYTERGLEIHARKEQIRRWFIYQYNKDRDMTTSFETGGTDPMALFVASLLGVSLKKLRRKTPYNVWGPEYRYFIDPIFEDRVREGGVPAKKQAALRSALYKELFEELTPEEQEEWKQHTIEEHEKELERIEGVLDGPPSTKSEDRQLVIHSLAKVLQPFLDKIAAYSGWKVSLLAGGPEPGDGGRLNVVSVHSGETTGEVKMNFGRSERHDYGEHIVPIFGNFLKKCYTMEECRSRALPTGGLSLSQVFDLDADGINVDSLSWDFDRQDSPASGASWNKRKYAAETPPTFAVPPPATNAKATSKKKRSKRATKGDPKPNIKIGPPKGKKRLPSHVQDVPSSGAGAAVSSASNDAASSVPAIPPPLLQQGVTSRAPSSPESCPPPLPASRVPSPAPSRPPTPAHSRAPSAAPSGPSTTAHSRLPSAPSGPPPQVHSRAPSAVPSRPPTPVPSVSPAIRQAPAGSPSHQPHHAMPSTTPSISYPNQVTATYTTPRTPSESPFRPSPPPPGTLLREELSPARGEPSSDAVEPSEQTDIPEAALKPAAVKRGRADEDDEAGGWGREPRGSMAQTTRKRNGSTDSRSPQKKRRTDAALASTSTALLEVEHGTISAPQNSPEWVKKVVGMFTSNIEGWDPAWMGLITTWLSFEQQEGYKGSSFLSSLGRPECIHGWIKSARSPTYRPSFNLAKFEKDFNTWWRGLQPGWRVEGGAAALSKDGADLETLRKAGPNGLLSVVAALFFWRVACGDKKSTKIWASAMEDVSWALDRLLRPH